MTDVHDEIEGVAQRIGGLIRVDQQHRGWSFVDLSHTMLAPVFPEPPERWSVELLGPSVDTEWGATYDGAHLVHVLVRQQRVGMIEAPTSERLIELAEQVVDRLALR